MVHPTEAWVHKAEGDYRSMERESAVVIEPNPDAVCFLAQQCVEKYLKGRLNAADRPIRRIHDLVGLLDDIIDLEPTWRGFRHGFGLLNEFAVNSRYPGDVTTADDAREAVEACRRFRAAARMALGLPA